MLISNITLLPARIVDVLNNSGFDKSFRCALKTDVKPNATIPILWLVSTDTHLLLCNTHATRGLYKKISWDSINSIQKIQSSIGVFSLKIIHASIESEDSIYSLPSKASLRDVNEFIDSCVAKND